LSGVFSLESFLIKSFFFGFEEKLKKKFLLQEKSKEFLKEQLSKIKSLLRFSNGGEN